MNQTEPEIRECADLVVTDFRLEENPFSPVHEDMEAFRQKLRSLIAHLLDHDFERLLQAMYRLDINENKFRKSLSGKFSTDVALEIADLVIERELQKVITRRKYREGLL